MKNHALAWSCTIPPPGVHTKRGVPGTLAPAGIGADYPVWNVSVTPEIRYRTIDDADSLTLGMGAGFRS